MFLIPFMPRVHRAFSPRAVCAAFATALLLCSAAVFAQGDKEKAGRVNIENGANYKRPSASPRGAKRAAVKDGEAEARLIEIYKLAGQSKAREALAKAERLVNDHPNFQLAQLVYGDLLAAQSRPLRTLGDVPEAEARGGASTLAELRQESLMRLKALRERPAAGTIPSQFLALSPRNKHAIAVDASRSRLYLFENTEAGLKLLADYYISVGKSGIEKNVEGDSRTPLGIYFVTSNLDPRSLKDFYGSGALPINYPNQLDLKRGKTGSGIWLHGTPPGQFARAPLASDGCVVLANPDLERIVRTVEVRSTPVVIAHSLKWVAPQTAKADSKSFEDALHSWQQARSSGDMVALTSLYSSDFTSYGKTLTDWTLVLRGEASKIRGRSVQLKDLSYLRWTDSADTMVVTFGEVPSGARTGPVRRQYWMRQGKQWKIFFEGVIG
ncbi:L,D-transpeptidase family protein [Polaromonas sp.]|uniref:L,D-transpeptidase family protein n=1 Tax=Polaromonas sp. TaxID=1869339 RepID=UPI00272F5B10|nr:L,D-transpeptidase family protein [Polaromonas sp.]MDP1742540.1 L,D-transpeptidase family protein [Polaromonas sp.]